MFDTILRIIEERISIYWTDSDVAWNNVQYTPVAGTPFIRPVATQVHSGLIAGTADQGLWREFGLLTVQVFTNRSEGTRDNATLARKVTELFRGYSKDSLYCLAPHVETVGDTKEWYQSNVIVDFYFDHCTDDPQTGFGTDGYGV